MGQWVSKRILPNFCGCANEDMVSEKELNAVREVVEALRTNIEDVRHGWIFRPGPPLHQEVVDEMVVAMEKGYAQSVVRLLQAGWRLEAAQALYIFLSKLKGALIPNSIQALALDAEEISFPEVVASDILGLIKQDLPPRHLELLSLILGLLYTVVKFSPADELRGSTLPLSMLPLFFNIQQVCDWSNVVMVFVEMIRQAPTLIDIPTIERAGQLEE